MKLPEGKTEQEVLAAIEKCVGILAPSFAFGYFSREDMLQEARLFCLECLPKFDATRNLEAFFYSAVKHHLINIHRNKFKRADSPCKVCHKHEYSGGVEPTCQQLGGFCTKYAAWKKRNASKAKLVNPSSIDLVTDEQAEKIGLCHDSESEQAMQLKETLELIDRNLPAYMRSTYLKMRDGVSVPKEDAKQVKNFLRELLHE